MPRGDRGFVLGWSAQAFMLVGQEVASRWRALEDKGHPNAPRHIRPARKVIDQYDPCSLSISKRPFGPTPRCSDCSRLSLVSGLGTGWRWDEISVENSTKQLGQFESGFSGRFKGQAHSLRAQLPSNWTPSFIAFQCGSGAVSAASTPDKAMHVIRQPR